MHHAQNDAISDELRNQIHTLNQIIVDGLLSGDASEILGLYVEEVEERPEFASELESMVTQAGVQLLGSDIEVFHEFDITCSNVNPQFTWAVVSDFDDGFIVHVNGIRKRMFVSLLEAKGSFEDKLIGIHYVHDGDSWRVFDLQIHVFRVGGKSALEWGHEAKKLQEQGLAVPAQLRFIVAKSIIRPLPQMQYVEEGELLKVGMSIGEEIAALPQLPLTLQELPSAPLVYSISPHFVDGQLVAKVQYVSQFELSESALTPEVAAISEALSELLPGLCAESDLVMYRAFSEAPIEPSKNYEAFGVVYDCNGDAEPAI